MGGGCVFVVVAIVIATTITIAVVVVAFAFVIGIAVFAIVAIISVVFCQRQHSRRRLGSIPNKEDIPPDQPRLSDGSRSWSRL